MCIYTCTMRPCLPIPLKNPAAADLLIQAIDRVISEKTVTFDLAEMIPGSTELTCSAYGDKLVGTLS